MTIPTNPGTGGPDLQSAVDGTSEHYQGVGAIPRVGLLSIDSAIVVPTYLSVDVSAAGDNVLLAAQGGANRIYVLAGVLVASGDVSVQLYSNSAGTALTGPMLLAASTGFILPACSIGNVRTLGDQALVLNLSASVQVGGWLVCAIGT